MARTRSWSWPTMDELTRASTTAILESLSPGHGLTDIGSEERVKVVNRKVIGSEQKKHPDPTV